MSETGHVAFVPAEARSGKFAEVGASPLIVPVAVTKDDRGGLRELLDDLVERALARRGAPSPCIQAWSTMPTSSAARRADQLFRARRVGCSGVLYVFESLRTIAEPALSEADGDALVELARDADEVPVALLFAAEDEQALALRRPVTLAALLGTTSTRTPTPPHEAPTPRAAGSSAVNGSSDAWRSWALALSAVRGPQPLAVFERLFVQSYMPLANAITRGLDDPRALRAYEEFRRSFERTYSDAAATFGVSSRRPRLVMDIFELAAQKARQSGARSTHVVVVDSMRQDVGELVRDKLAARAPGLVQLASQALVFAALPTTTMRQLETLARGVDALRSPASEEPSSSLRGRSAETVRRLRIGPREIHKLDAIASVLAAVDLGKGAGDLDPFTSALEGAAEIAADALVRHLHGLAPRTLVLIVGDHGFCLDRRGRVSHGGAAPEEVLVPALAYVTRAAANVA